VKKTPLALFLACGLILTGGAAAAASLVLHTPNATRVLTDCGFDGEQQGASDADKACNDADKPDHQTGMDEQGTTGDKADQTGDANDQMDKEDEHDGEDADYVGPARALPSARRSRSLPQ